MDNPAQSRIPLTEERDELSFNCVEQVLMRTNEASLILAFNESCMRIASVFGGGIGGSGNVCGAASGAVMAIGLALGTSGTETLDEFKEIRKNAKELVNLFLSNFTEAWGSIRCEHLLAMDEGKKEKAGTQRQNQQPVQNMCADYVDWSADMIISMLKQKSVFCIFISWQHTSTKLS